MHFQVFNIKIFFLFFRSKYKLENQEILGKVNGFSWDNNGKKTKIKKICIYCVRL
jgi:hypothetical protein